MNKNSSISLVAIGTILTSLSIGAEALADNETKFELIAPASGDSAGLLATLIERGDVTLDINSGKLAVNASVISILEEHNLIVVDETNLSEAQDGGRTGGGSRT